MKSVYGLVGKVLSCEALMAFLQVTSISWHSGTVITQELQAVVAHDVMNKMAHLDRQKGRHPTDAYYSTFVDWLDLFLAIHAHCVIYGIG